MRLQKVSAFDAVNSGQVWEFHTYCQQSILYTTACLSQSALEVQMWAFAHYIIFTSPMKYGVGQV